MRSYLKLLCCAVFLTLATGLTGLAKSDKEAEKNAPTSEKKDDKKKDSDKKKSDDKKKKGDDKKKDKKKEDDKKEPADASGSKLNLPLVEGHDSLGLKIPYTDAKGKLQMIYYIGVATRLDKDKIQMKETKVETYNDEGEVEVTVDLPVSELDLVTKFVTSNTETKIKREDFTIRGDGVKFDTVNKVASLVGHIKMIVYDLNDEAATPPPAPADSNATPPAPANANE